MARRDDLGALSYDYIVVGGGPAGCVVASRLSEDRTVKVLLLEAGQDFEPSATPADIEDVRMRSHANAAYKWTGVLLERIAGPGEPVDLAGPLTQARVIGGGSSLNGMHAQRGFADDYDSWRELGVTGWSWSDVLPFFKRVENDLDFEGPSHGRSGPFRISRVPERHWSPFSRAVRDALEAEGAERIEDINDGVRKDGVGAVPLGRSGGKRVSTAAAYLTPEVRQRGNLRIMGEAPVSKVLFEGRRAVGVEVGPLDAPRRFRGDNIVICSGAAHSPAVLLRSGVGPSDELRNGGIAVVADRPGVGKNLSYHPAIMINARLRRKARAAPGPHHPGPLISRHTSGVSGCPPTDMAIDWWERTPGGLQHDPILQQITMITVITMFSYSRGEVVLAPEGDRPPRVRYNLKHDPRDLARMADAVVRVFALLEAPSMSHLVSDVFFNTTSRLTAGLMHGGLSAQVLSMGSAGVLNGPGWFRRWALSRGGAIFSNHLKERGAIERLISERSLPGTHIGGTCRMGDAADPLTVTDSRCRVIGVEGLRVVDSSIFPVLMRAGPYLPIMMAGEKAAAMMVEDRRSLCRLQGRLNHS